MLLFGSFVRSASTLPAAAPGAGLMRIICPQCRNSIESALDAGGEVLCPACGSGFRLEQGSTTGWAATERGRKLGRFELMDLLGTGAFGAVYLARDPELDRVVAVKVPHSGG